MLGYHTFDSTTLTQPLSPFSAEQVSKPVTGSHTLTQHNEPPQQFTFITNTTGILPNT